MKLVLVIRPGQGRLKPLEELVEPSSAFGRENFEVLDPERDGWFGTAIAHRLNGADEAP